jgi:hypothetical protein
MKTQELIHRGDLRLNNVNADDFKDIEEIDGDLIIKQGCNVELKKLTEVSGYIYVRQNATLTAPALTISGSIYVAGNNATLTAPELTKSGYIYVGQTATLNIPQTKGLNYKSVDNTFFVIISEKILKGIKILSGYVIKSITDGKADKVDYFVAEKDGFYAHGETIKKAISDLQFKIASEKLKKEPINADTLVTIQHYRLITGACEAGVKDWMERNSIDVDSIRADELLPILQKTNAYGLGRFKSLLSF